MIESLGRPCTVLIAIGFPEQLSRRLISCDPAKIFRLPSYGYSLDASSYLPNTTDNQRQRVASRLGE